MAKKSWFKAARGDNEGDIVIYNDIGYFGVTAQDFHESLSGLGAVDTLNVHISSDGGTHETRDGAAGFLIETALDHLRASTWPGNLDVSARARR
jgi:hypothetical protein